jgi:hypothetical protein
VSQRDTAYQPRATPWVASTSFPGVLKERRISVNGGCVLYPTVCGVPSERLNGFPRIPRVAPWAGMHRPFGAEADPTLLPDSHVNRPWSNKKRFVFGLVRARVRSLFCQPESINIDFAKALTAAPLPNFMSCRRQADEVPSPYVSSRIAPRIVSNYRTIELPNGWCIEVDRPTDASPT